MLPVCGQMNSSYPYQSNPVPITQCYIPTSENLPQHQMEPNPPNFPTMNMPWPHGSNYVHPTPCHVCCSHSGFPGGYYTIPPPCPHFVMAPPLNCNHSAFPQGYPVRYDPPPHYSAVQPRYEHDKSAHRDSHCCGCPNHTGCQKEERSVKIEEMDTGNGKKGTESLIPVQLGNHPYQVVWVSPELLKKNMLGGHEKVPSEVKPAKESKPLHQEENSRYSLDLKGQGGDRKKLQNGQEEDSQSKFSFPVIWMPYDVQKEVDENDHKAKDDGREMSKMPSPKHVEESYPTLKHADGSEKTGKPRTTQDNRDGKSVEKSSSLRSIPVKQMGHHEERVSEDAKREAVKNPVKHAEDGVSKTSESNGKRQSSAPSKIAKLPPVCLRVDPLPRKKNCNGSSRSPSPPDQKRREEAAKDSSGVHGDKTEQVLKSKEMEPNRKEGRTIQVMDGSTVEDKKADLKNDVDLKDVANLPNESHKEASANTTTEKTEEDGNGSRRAAEKSEIVLEKAAEVPNEVEQRMDPPKPADGGYERQNKRSLTEAEAALLIQSAYRGYVVRRWDPLMKLKQIAEVRAQLVDVRNHIEALESAEDMLKDNKQTAGVGEMIMRLLLKLDSIQGLHPSLREVRKSLARELVTLQEKLDSLMVEKSKKCTEEVSTSGPAHHGDETFKAGAEKVQDQTPQGSTCQSSCDNSGPVVDLPNPQCVTHESSKRSENGSESLVEQMEGGLGISEVAGSEKGEFLGTNQEQPFQLPSTAEEKSSSEEETITEGVTEELSGNSNGAAVKELEESVQEVISEKSTTVSEMGEQTEVEEYESLPTRRMDGDAPADPVLDDGDLPAEACHPKRSETDGEVNVPEELSLGAADPLELSCEPVPLGAVEPDLVVPKCESHEQVGSEKSEILGGEGNDNCTASYISSLPKEECSREQQAPEVVNKTQDSNEPPRDIALQMEVAPQVPTADPVKNEQQKNTPPEDTDQQQERGEIHVEEENHGLTGDTQLELGRERCATQGMAAPVGDIKEEPVSCENEEMETTGLQEAGIAVEVEPVEEAEHQMEKEEAELLPTTQLESKKSAGSDKRLIEENEKLREMMAKLMETGKEQLTVISDLSGRVKDLEKKLAKKKKVRTMRKHKGAASESSRLRKPRASVN